MKMHRLRPNLLLCLLCFLAVSCRDKALFRQLSSKETGITFNNKITESDSLNPVDVTNIYNGGGVGVGDFNNDGLQDLYFAGNQVACKLYLNKGKMAFEDVTNSAGVAGMGRWCRGVTVVDINGDGWQDLYVSVTLTPDTEQRRNLLFVNQGLDKEKKPRFVEMAAEYGLNDDAHATHAAFFDYDNDSDLDMYLVVNVVNKRDNPAAFRPKMKKGESPSTGKLYRNDWSDSLNHPVYVDVTAMAGTTIEGYGHSVSIADFNKDGWKDIFVANDFLTNDLLYINNRDGSFTDKAEAYFKHTSSNGMGQDVIDINNDGLSDVIELDMNPEDNYRKKMMMNANNYGMYQNSDFFGYQYQYVRNTLQINQGPRVLGNDSVGDPIFSDIGFLSGISETDWSWTPLVQDYDNDGFRDILVTNGFPKDVTDHDFAAYATVSSKVASRSDLVAEIPEVKVHNYAFRNNGDLTFTDLTESWGLTTPSFSNGAAQADLDNDGDMDFVVNNINDEAFLYENTAAQKEDQGAWLTLQLKGEKSNPQGFGVWLELYYPGGKQFYEQSPYRGYLSSIDVRPHFGLGKAKQLDSLVVKWPNGRMQVLRNVPVNRILELTINEATQAYAWNPQQFASGALFTNIGRNNGIDFLHQEREFIDFNIQKLLPHKLSEYGPAMAAGDVDGNGTDDLVLGGSAGYSPVVLLQDTTGQFSKRTLMPDGSNKPWEDMGIALFDADGDGDLDLYTAAGGYEADAGSDMYLDHFFINNGKGYFSEAPGVLPRNTASKSCVRVGDYDRDGDLDVFVGSRVVPRQYPRAGASALYRNDSKAGMVQFTDVTAAVAPGLASAGMVCDALWTDHNNDGWLDLLFAPEWGALTVFQNNKGNFSDVSDKAGLAAYSGWWNSLLPGDFDKDGDIDYVAGNLGRNSFYRGSKEEPVRIYAKDFNSDGAYDAVPTVYLRSSHDNPEKKEFPAHVKDDMAKQLIQFRLKFTDYKSYASATFRQMFTEEELKDVLKLEANWFSHSLVRNDGNGRFTLHPLPQAAQLSCFNGMNAADFNGDGNLDLMAIGNDYGPEPIVGRYDACNGLMLLGDGRGGFQPVSMLQAGLFVPGNARSLVQLRSASGGLLVAAAQNRGPLQLFRSNTKQKLLSLQPKDATALVTLADGSTQRFELNYGSSFLSQSARVLALPAGARGVQVITTTGVQRSEN